MQKREFKDRLYTSFAGAAKALSSPKRVELIELLAQTERTVEWLAEATGMTVANTSQHLQVLRGARLVDSRKDGLYVRYRLASPAVWDLFRALRGVAEDRDAEVGRLVSGYFGDRDQLDAVAMAGLLERAERGEIVVIDVRPADEFAAAHIPGARSAPVPDLDGVTASLPRDRVVVAYCRGPYCVLADEAVQRLRAAGFDARRLDGGLPDWRADGHPVAQGEA
jgi:rhodanese-related sulfurtransferase/DNA-binding transcriptional ArsR family regulator